MPVRNCQLDVLGRAYREGISEQNPDQSEIEKDDYENGTAKRQRKKLVWQHTVHQQVSCPEMDDFTPEANRWQSRTALEILVPCGRCPPLGISLKWLGFTLIFTGRLIYLNNIPLRRSHDLGATNMGLAPLSIDQLGMINRCLIVVLIAAYFALGYFVVSDLLQPGSSMTSDLTGSGAQWCDTIKI
jgi:hypothetical protein